MAMTAVALALAGPMAAGAAADDASTAPAPAPAAPAAPAKAGAPAIESALLTEMNRVRTDRGRRPLRAVATLQRPARGQSRYLVDLGILDHDGSDGSPFWTRLIAAGFPRGHTMGENLAMVPGCGPEAAAQTVQLWLDSPGHRANLLNPRFRWVGAGAGSSGDCSSTVLTADFGS